MFRVFESLGPAGYVDRVERRLPTAKINLLSTILNLLSRPFASPSFHRCNFVLWRCSLLIVISHHHSTPLNDSRTIKNKNKTFALVSNLSLSYWPFSNFAVGIDYNFAIRFMLLRWSWTGSLYSASITSLRYTNCSLKVVNSNSSRPKCRRWQVQRG